MVQNNLKSEEFLYLINFFNFSFIIGFKSKYFDKSDNSIAYGKENVQKRLIKNKILIQDGIEIKINETILANLRTITSPRHCLICAQQSGKGKERNSSLYFGKKATKVLLTEPRKDSYQVEELDDIADISPRMLGLPDDQHWKVDPKAQLILDEKDFNQFRSWAQKKQIGPIKEKFKILKIDLGNHLRTSFIKALGQPSYHASLVFIRNVDQPQKSSVGGFALLASDEMLWLLEVIEKEKISVKIQTADLKLIEQKVNKLLPKEPRI